MKSENKIMCFVEQKCFPFFLAGALTSVLLTACQDGDSVAEVAVRLHCFTFLSWAEEVVVKEDQGTGFGDSD